VNLPAEVITPVLAALGHVLFLLALIWAAVTAPWWHLSDNEDTHVLLATGVALLFLWVMKAGVAPGLEFHLLGVTLATLMFGWQFAILVVGVVLLATTIHGNLNWPCFGWNGLLLVFLPVLVTWFVLRMSERHLPGNFFIYIFVAAFFGAALAMLSVGVVSTVVLWAFGAYPWQRLMEHYAVFYMLMVFPEAFLTGAMMTIFVVYRPAWVATFDDERYLRDR
jgi:uncharacterized membrane protein